MIFTILTLFPEIVSNSLNYSIVKRAKDKKLVTINCVNIRDFATDKYKTVDDKPYGGGVGMILKVDVVDRALNEVKNLSPQMRDPANQMNQIKAGKLKIKNSRTRIILLDPKGTKYTQSKAVILSKFDHIILICGHYEGVDARVEELVDESVSIGDYVVTGGEIPALVVVDSVTRLLPGVIREGATESESFTYPEKLEAPQYTRPEEYKSMKVPEILLSGNHAAISRWQQQMAKKIK